MNLAPVTPKLSQSNVFGSFPIALLGVALDAHGLIVPFAVWALLGTGDDVVPIHQNGTLITLMHRKQVDVLTTTVVNPDDDDIALTTTADTLATMHSKRFETRNLVGLAIGRLYPGTLMGPKGHFQSLFDGKVC